MSATFSQSARRYILTGGVTAITIVGALYGAGLKTQQEYKQEKVAILEATPEEKIAQLETTKSRYMQQKADLQAKIDRLTSKTKGDSGNSESKPLRVP